MIQKAHSAWMPIQTTGRPYLDQLVLSFKWIDHLQHLEGSWLIYLLARLEGLQCRLVHAEKTYRIFKLHFLNG